MAPMLSALVFIISHIAFTLSDNPCQPNLPCDLNCGNYTNVQCADTVINASLSTNLTISCPTLSSCRNMTAICPKGNGLNTCEITCTDSLSCDATTIISESETTILNCITTDVNKTNICGNNISVTLTGKDINMASINCMVNTSNENDDQVTVCEDITLTTDLTATDTNPEALVSFYCQGQGINCNSIGINSKNIKRLEVYVSGKQSMINSSTFITDEDMYIDISYYAMISMTSFAGNNSGVVDMFITDGGVATDNSFMFGSIDSFSINNQNDEADNGQWYLFSNNTIKMNSDSVLNVFGNGNASFDNNMIIDGYNSHMLSINNVPTHSQLYGIEFQKINDTHMFNKADYVSISTNKDQMFSNKYVLVSNTYARLFINNNGIMYGNIIDAQLINEFYLLCNGTCFSENNSVNELLLNSVSNLYFEVGNDDIINSKNIEINAEKAQNFNFIIKDHGQINDLNLMNISPKSVIIRNTNGTMNNVSINAANADSFTLFCWGGCNKNAVANEYYLSNVTNIEFDVQNDEINKNNTAVIFTNNADQSTESIILTSYSNGTLSDLSFASFNQITTVTMTTNDSGIISNIVLAATNISMFNLLATENGQISDISMTAEASDKIELKTEDNAQLSNIGIVTNVNVFNYDNPQGKINKLMMDNTGNDIMNKMNITFGEMSNSVSVNCSVGLCSNITIIGHAADAEFDCFNGSVCNNVNISNDNGQTVVMLMGTVMANLSNSFMTGNTVTISGDSYLFTNNTIKLINTDSALNVYGNGNASFDNNMIIDGDNSHMLSINNVPTHSQLYGINFQKINGTHLFNKADYVSISTNKDQMFVNKYVLVSNTYARMFINNNGIMYGNTFDAQLINEFYLLCNGTCFDDSNVTNSTNLLVNSVNNLYFEVGNNDIINAKNMEINAIEAEKINFKISDNGQINDLNLMNISPKSVIIRNTNGAMNNVYINGANAENFTLECWGGCNNSITNTFYLSNVQNIQFDVQNDVVNNQNTKLIFDNNNDQNTNSIILSSYSNGTLRDLSFDSLESIASVTMTTNDGILSNIYMNSTNISMINVVSNENGQMNNISIATENSENIQLNCTQNGQLNNINISANAKVLNVSNAQGIINALMINNNTVNLNTNVINTINVNIFGEMSNSIINGQNSDNVSILCSNVDPNTNDDIAGNCENITLYTPKDPNAHSSLLCQNEGCQNITFYTKNSIDDINNISLTDCQCQSAVKSSCILEGNQWTIHCKPDYNNNYKSSVLSGNKCEGECCGDVVKDLRVTDCDYGGGSGKSSNVGAIVGGICGGLLVVAMICVGVYFVYSKRKMAAAENEALLIND